MSDVPPENPDSVEVSALRRVVAACERYEVAWKGGRAPRIEDFLHDVPPAERDPMLRELIGLEIELRGHRGERATPEEYLERFPNQATAVGQVFREGDVNRSGSSESFTSGPKTSLASSRAAHGETDSTRAATPVPGRSSTIEGDEPIPPRLGRYCPTRLLGEGGFGRVYLARDDQLGRLVAIKVPRARVLGSAEQVESFLAEARLAAGLKHPAIVTVHDVGREGEHVLFVVLEYIEGPTLADLFRDQRPSPARLATLMVRVAEAAHHAHKGGLVHRDLKPANILIDARGEPHVTDFGLAVREEFQYLRTGEIAGTPAYMAPEQVRGETHRLDGRTDVWALGVILYQGLLGRPPFAGRGRSEVFEEILHRDPKPPRQVEDTVPRELERICLKCLARRMADRYQTAIDLADDLKTWMAAEVSTATVIPPAIASAADSEPLDPRRPRVMPKGLRAFGVEDADFFLRLLPGPVDRNGLPESVRSWKARIEERNPSKTFPVGLLYGPSGCGKSSMVKAGLLPRLARHVRSVYVEASADGTEARLLAALRREFVDLPPDLGLAGAAAALREGRAGPPGTKTLIVLDQFEQWLHHHPEGHESELVRALRQCDGSGLQALLLTRDEFWMGITRFLRALEVRLVEGENSSAVELFDSTHARRVLAEFGRARGRLPESGPIGTEAEKFLDQAVAELVGPDGRIIPVRLNLFAEMVRHRPWTPATIRDLGGIEGIGVTFLEETFCARSAPPSHRLHWRAAQGVFKALLPEPSSVLKGNLQSGPALRQAAGYADRPDDFAELLRIIDNELRMVTPVEPEGHEAGGDQDQHPSLDRPLSDRGETYYQLTHDYLVPPLRQWLTRKQRETRRGRAALRLEAITALWRDRPESRRLPSGPEWLGLLWDTRPNDWSPDEHRLMRAAARHHLVRAGAAAALLAALAFVGWSLRERSRGNSLLAQALKADFRHLPELIPRLADRRDQIRAGLERIESDTWASAREQEVAALLLFREWPTPSRAATLRQRLRAAEPDETALIAEALAAHPEIAGLEGLRGELADESVEPATRLRVACVLARIEPGRDDERLAAAKAVSQALLVEDRRAVPRWLALLGPAVPSLIAPLAEACRDGARDSATRATAAEALADALGRREDSEALARLVVETRPGASRILLRELAGLERREPALASLHGVLEERADDPLAEVRKDEVAARQAAAAVALAILGEPKALWPLLAHHDDPRLRSLLIQKLAATDLTPRLLLERPRRTDIPPAERQAILLAWAETPRAGILATLQGPVVDLARALYRDDPDPGVHAAAELLLARWNHRDLLDNIDKELRDHPTRTVATRWRLGPNGHTFAVLPGPLAFWMGSPPHEAEREPVRHDDHVDIETRHYRRIDRGLAVATKEVTFAQFVAFRAAHKQKQDLRYGASPESPANNLSWFDAVNYCNWLSQQDGIPPDQWCYVADAATGMRLESKALTRTGYRLPTEAEWEYFCRAGTVTAYSYGQSEELLPKHGWTWLSSKDRTLPVGELLPNEFGLFDTLGNVWEWCHDGLSLKDGRTIAAYPPGTPDRPALDAPPDEVLRAEPGTVSQRHARGGSYSYAPSSARSAKRYVASISLTHPYLGFRVVRSIPGGESPPTTVADR